MIEDYQAKRRRSRQIARALQIGGVVLAFAAAVATYAAVAGRPATVEPVDTAPVVVAVRDIPARSLLSAQDVKVARLPADTVPTGALTDVSAAIGGFTAVAIARNEPILQGKLGSTASAVLVFPAGTEPTGSAPDFRGMSLEIPDADAVGGEVQPGDVVDIVLSLGFESARLGLGTLDSDAAARIVAERVPVLARSKSIYTFRVDAAQAERIVALQAAGGKVHLLLRSAQDTRSPRASGAIYSNEARNLIRAIPTGAR
ncbi:MAG TPA: Flp pilus assembly protein CpaB [Candidatus Limnocylindria bacterium]|nr:Flp pilus assembly protein CpaB [Candidatus Limnocylindria bacterium]